MEGTGSSGVPSPSAPPSTSTPPAQQQQSSQGGSQPSGSPKSPPTPGNTPSAPEIFEIKVNGKTVKMTKQEAIDHASMSYAANEKFNEASKIRKELDQKKALYQKDPLQAFLDHTEGMTPEQRRDLLEKYYAKQYIEPETLSAEERKMREREEKVKKWEEEQVERKGREEKEHEAKLTNQQRDHIQTQIIEALDQSNLPKSKETVKKIAFYMRQNLLNGWDAPMDMIIRQVKNERQSSFREEIKSCTVEQIVELLGEEEVNRIRKYDLQRLRDSRQSPIQNGGGKAGTGVVSGGEEKLSYRDVNERLRAIRQGKL